MGNQLDTSFVGRINQLLNSNQHKIYCCFVHIAFFSFTAMNLFGEK